MSDRIGADRWHVSGRFRRRRSRPPTALGSRRADTCAGRLPIRTASRCADTCVGRLPIRTASRTALDMVQP